MFKFTSSIIVVLMCVLGARYLANPDTWNQQPVAGIESPSVPLRPADEVHVLTPESSSGPTGRRFLEANILSCHVSRQVVTASVNSPVYRWIDENGQVHFSDKAADNAELYDLQLPVRMNYFNLEIDYRGPDSVPFLRGQLTPQVTAIYEILAESKYSFCCGLRRFFERLFGHCVHSGPPLRRLPRHLVI